MLNASRPLLRASAHAKLLLISSRPAFPRIGQRQAPLLLSPRVSLLIAPPANSDANREPSYPAPSGSHFHLPAAPPTRAAPSISEVFPEPSGTRTHFHLPLTQVHALPVYLVSCDRALSQPKVDGFVSRTRRVNLRIVSQGE